MFWQINVRLFIAICVIRFISISIKCWCSFIFIFVLLRGVRFIFDAAVVTCFFSPCCADDSCEDGVGVELDDCVVVSLLLDGVVVLLEVS